MVYGIFTGLYDDWDVIGYFDTREKADKFCCTYGNGDFYVISLDNLSDKCDLSQVSIKYEHEVIFDYKYNSWKIREDQENYFCYVDDDLRCNNVRRDRKNRFVAFRVNIKTYDRKLAEKIARNYLYEILAHGNGRIYDKNIEWMNVKFKESCEGKKK